MLKEKRHKWDQPVYGDNYYVNGGRSAYCINCGCVKERIKGIITYFINDTVYDKAPPCDERLLNKKVSTIDTMNSFVVTPKEVADEIVGEFIYKVEDL